RFFNLSPEKKNAVYEYIYNLATEQGKVIDCPDHEYGKLHVFDSEERLEQAMNEVLKTHP
ncbi:MAG: hypothetical protein KAR79_03230, partial [Simkaniaceae bacterium]|nr:hypothetical protein [Simkaniaceae bacterium]